jgi:hypothetical protein
MNSRDHLDMRLGSELQALGGILDKIDYNEIRGLGNQLRNIPHVSDDWDLPPASLADWVTSYRASKRVVVVAWESGLLKLLQEHDEEIREALSPEIIPQADAELAGKDTLYEMIESAKKSDLVKSFDPERFQADAPSQDELARALVVQIDLHLSWQERPKVNEETGKSRLKIGAIVGQGVLGGALAGVNLSLGVLGNYIPHIAAMVGQVPTTVGIAASTYTGLSKVFEAVEKLAGELKKQ